MSEKSTDVGGGLGLEGVSGKMLSVSSNRLVSVIATLTGSHYGGI